jgi:holliday junction DNA helicase RuvA
MIRSLTGKIKEITNNYVLVEVMGVGYLVYSPNTQSFKVNETTTIFTYLAVRENALDLYGFINQPTLQTFECLLGIPKIGPKSAVQILSQASPELIAEAVQKNDGVYLHKLSGLGKKTAENIVQYLQNKQALLPSVLSDSKDNLNSIQTDAIDVLVSLGYDIANARSLILELSDADSSVNSLVTQALRLAK